MLRGSSALSAKRAPCWGARTQGWQVPCGFAQRPRVLSVATHASRRKKQQPRQRKQARQPEPVAVWPEAPEGRDWRQRLLGEPGDDAGSSAGSQGPRPPLPPENFSPAQQRAWLLDSLRGRIWGDLDDAEGLEVDTYTAAWLLLELARGGRYGKQALAEQLLLTCWAAVDSGMRWANSGGHGLADTAVRGGAGAAQAL